MKCFSSPLRCERKQVWPCDTVIDNKTYILVFMYCSWHIAPQTLLLSYVRAIGASFAIIFSFVPSSWNSSRAIKVKRLSLFISEFCYLFSKKLVTSDFWKTPKEGGWLPGEPAQWFPWVRTFSPISRKVKINHEASTKLKGWSSEGFIGLVSTWRRGTPGEGMEGSSLPLPKDRTLCTSSI